MNREYVIITSGVLMFDQATEKNKSFWSNNHITDLGLTKAQFIEQRKYNDKQGATS